MGSKKTSPVKMAKTATSSAEKDNHNATVDKDLPGKQLQETNEDAVAGGDNSHLASTLISCKHLTALGEFLKMYYLTACNLLWKTTQLRRQCKECSNSTPPLLACLQCSFFGCINEPLPSGGGNLGKGCNYFPSRHLSETGHALGLEMASGAVYCAVCKVWVWTDLLESLWKEAHMSGGSGNGNSTNSPTIFTFECLQSYLAEAVNAENPRLCPRVRGLWNLGNTCFMNCILQTILHTGPLQEYFMNPDSTQLHLGEKCPRRREGAACIACETDTLFTGTFNGEATPLSPNRMLEALWRSSKDLAGYEQQDAHELFVTWRNLLHTHLGGAMYNCSCVVHRIFSGVLQSDLTCLQCANVTETLDPFLDISLDLGPALGPLHLTECLQRFTHPEHLPVGSYICANCNMAHSEISKQLTIRTLPTVLTIHLKRFEHGSASTKIDTPLLFSSTLDLAPYLNPAGIGPVSPDKKSMDTGLSSAPPSHKYSLFAVVSHVGNLDSGHYTAYVKSRGDWFWIDDGAVVRCSPEAVFNCNAYMLFYLSLRS